MEEQDLNTSQDGNTPTGAGDPPSTSTTPTKPALIEDNIEDRYNKLKMMAVKLKRKVGEQAEEITNLKAAKDKLQERSNTASKIQQEFDKAQDEIERLKKIEGVLNKDLKGAVDECCKLKELRLEETSQIQTLTNSHKNLREKLQSLSTVEDEKNIWRSRAEELEKELKELKETQKDALQERRSMNLLSLEISDYEKKLGDCSEELEVKNQEIRKLNEEAESKERIVQAQLAELRKLEEIISKLTSNKEDLMEEVTAKSERITLLGEQLAKLSEDLSVKTAELNGLEVEYEEEKLNWANASKEITDRNAFLHKTILALEQKNSILEENRRSRESQINNLNLELKQLESEYKNYKVKAQAMLNSSKPRTLKSQESDDLENSMQKIIQDFNSEISSLKSDIATLRIENENLNLEKSEVLLKFNSSKVAFGERESQLELEIQRLGTELRSKQMEVQNASENAKIERNELNSFFRGEVEKLKVDHEAELSKFRDKIDMLSKARNTTPERELPHEFTSLASDWSPNSPPPPPLSHPLSIDVSHGVFEGHRMMPRGECEGSESVNSNPQVLRKGSFHNSLTFEQLLNSSAVDSLSPSNYEAELEAERKNSKILREELLKSSNQIKHLTILLRDSEGNCDRLGDLSNALKEEIRRMERDAERKEHLKENTEYFKNVLLKFVTLNGEEEKLQLIPVFKTVLRLTQEECDKLESSVREKFDQNKEKGGGWTSYIWSTSGD